MVIYIYTQTSKLNKSKKEDTNQESIQPSTIPDTGYHRKNRIYCFLIVYILSVSEDYFYIRLVRGPCVVVVPRGVGKTSPHTSI